MIASAPTAAADDVVGLAAKVKAFVAQAHDAAADGLTVAEFGELTVALLRVAVSAADTIPVSGAERKSFVLNAVALLFDELADRMIPTLAWPLWVLARPAVRAIVLKLADGAIESLLPLVRLAQ